jgi:hypothetical protein
VVSLTGRECEEGWRGSDAPGEKGEGGQGRVLDIGGSMVDAGVAREAVWIGGGREGGGIS